MLSRPAASRILYRPWFDRAANALLCRWYFPLSRAWAAALAIGRGTDRFADAVGEVGARPPAALARALAEVDRVRAAHRSAAVRWEQTVFADLDPGAAAVAGAERERAGAAFALMQARRAFLPLHARRRFPAVRFGVASEADLAGRHAMRRVGAADAFPAAADPGLRVSHEYVADGIRHYWLRGETTVAGRPDMLWARVREPLRPAARPAAPGGPHPALPSVVFAHGLGIEEEFWGDQSGIAAELLARGVRVVQPEGPWHGRRRPDGFYGGEPVCAWGVAGMADYFAAHVPELARLIAWTRQRSRGPVGLAGVSLGGLAAQLAATAAEDWPESMRPDALLLVAVTGAMADVAFRGALAAGLGVPRALAAAGWTEARTEPWRPLLEPQGLPALSPDRIAMVLGAADAVTPFEGGLALARRWHVPDRNLWVRRQGHYSLFLGLAAAPAPLDWLADTLARVRPGRRREPQTRKCGH